jgi:hypothetical protein
MINLTYFFLRHVVTNASGFNLFLYCILNIFIGQVQDVELFFGKILRNSKSFFKVPIHTISHSKCYIADVLVAKSESQSWHLKDLLNVEKVVHKVLYKINAFLCGLYLRFYDSYLSNFLATEN